jgi:hypothetical protein
MSATISTSASSSGDLRADRRFLYAEESAATGDHSAAAELLEQFLEIVPYWAPAWFALGVAREKLGDADAAQQAYARALACDPQDVLGASLALARLGAAPVPASATPAYVVRLFDQYARRFDAHLVEGLGYRAPALLRDAVADVRRRMARPMHFARALDLGCGTGLAGAAFRDCVDRLEGLDLSAAMIAEARAKGIYDVLEVGDIIDHLRATPDRTLIWSSLPMPSSISATSHRPSRKSRAFSRAAVYSLSPPRCTMAKDISSEPTHVTRIRKNTSKRRRGKLASPCDS